MDAFLETVPPVVLLVEDEVLVRMVAADLLSDAGYRVVEAEHAAAAVAVLEGDDDIAVLFTDIQMPGRMDGLGLASFVAETRPDVGIIVASGRVMPDRSELPGGGTFLPKPYDPDTVLALVSDIVRGRKASLSHGGRA